MNKKVTTEQAELVLDYIQKRFIPFMALEAYMSSLSTTKLIKVAEKVLSPSIELYGPQEAVYEEIITRLKDRARSECFVGEIVNGRKDT